MSRVAVDSSREHVRNNIGEVESDRAGAKKASAAPPQIRGRARGPDRPALPFEARRVEEISGRNCARNPRAWSGRRTAESGRSSAAATRFATRRPAPASRRLSRLAGRRCARTGLPLARLLLLAVGLSTRWPSTPCRPRKAPRHQNRTRTAENRRKQKFRIRGDSGVFTQPVRGRGGSEELPPPSPY